MKAFDVFLFEWKHFSKSPFKIIALILFVIAGIYGLHNGASLFYEQNSVIEKLNEKIEQERAEVIEFYKEGKKGPESRPWIDYTTPFWAIWSAEMYQFKKPSPAIVYSIGQAEQYGFYKRVTFQSNPYDADMAEEISNPERLQIGALDFSFVILFLLPLLVLVLTYNLKSYENEQGFLSLILVQSASKNSWLLTRLLFYVVTLSLVLILILFYGSLLTDVFDYRANVFFQVLILVLCYLLFWTFFYYLILRNGKNILGNTLKMVGFYLVFTFIIPATVHQWISVHKPMNLMTDYIDAKRDKVYTLYDEPDSILKSMIFDHFPNLKNTKIAQDSIKSNFAMNQSFSVLSNQLMKEGVSVIEKENAEKNRIIQNSYWINPIVYFQNQFNKKAETHYDDYQEFRNDIQQMIDKQIKVLVTDIYHDKKVDQSTYLNYIQSFSND